MARCGSLQLGRDPQIAEIPPIALRSAGCRHASIGPRSSDRGNGNITNTGGHAYTLQLGRDPQIAEMILPGFRSCDNRQLQLGRDPQIAEMSPVPAPAPPPEPASIGPRSSDRGNLRVPDGWRGVRRASIGPRSSDRGNSLPPQPQQAGIQCFNWAAILRSRKSAAAGRGRKAPSMLQLGRDPQIAEMM